MSMRYRAGVVIAAHKIAKEFQIPEAIPELIAALNSIDFEKFREVKHEFFEIVDYFSNVGCDPSLPKKLAESIDLQKSNALQWLTEIVSGRGYAADDQEFENACERTGETIQSNLMDLGWRYFSYCK